MDHPTFITTSCPECGPIDVDIDDLVLRVADDGLEASIPVHCPVCGARFAAPVDDGMCLILVQVGIAVQTWARPAEIDERPTQLEPLRGVEVAGLVAALDQVDDIGDLFATS